jgi:hypothetical protein
MTGAVELAVFSGVAGACLALGVARATFCRARQPVQMRMPRAQRKASPLALPVAERQAR